MPWAATGVRESTCQLNKMEYSSTHVMSPLGYVLYRGIVVAPRGGIEPGAGMIGVELTPPVQAEKPFNSIGYVVCRASRVTLGWF